MRSDPQYARALVFRRDRGICGLCGLDTEYLKATADWLVGLTHKRWHVTKDCTGNWPPFRDLDEAHEPGDPRAEHALERLAREFWGQRRSGWRWEWGDHLWEADHIVPVVEGGGECGLDGLRTLCVPCHRRVTAELLRRRAGFPSLAEPGPQLLLWVPA